MKTKIEKFELKRLSKGFVEVDLPEESIYFFRYGMRIMFGIFPQWTTWQKQEGKEEEIWKYDIIAIENDETVRIEKFSIQVSSFDIIYNGKEVSYITMAVKAIIDGVKERERKTEEQFLDDYNSAIFVFNRIITSPK